MGLDSFNSSSRLFYSKARLHEYIYFYTILSFVWRVEYAVICWIYSPAAYQRGEPVTGLLSEKRLDSRGNGSRYEGIFTVEEYLSY